MQNAKVNAAHKADQDLMASSRTTMQAMISTREKIVQAFRAASQDANKAAEDSMKRQAELQTNLDDMQFKRRLEERQKYDDYYKKSDVLEKMYASRAMDLASEAAKKLSTAETPDQERSAEAVFKRAAAYAQEADQIARGTQDEWLRKDAADTVEAIVRKQIDAEKELQGNLSQRASVAARVAASEQQRVDQMKVLMKGILTDMDLFNKKGTEKKPQDTAALSADLKQKLAAFKAAWMEGGNIDLGEVLKFTELEKKVKTAMEGGVSEAEINKLFAAPQAIDELRHQIEGDAGLAVKIRPLLDFASPDLAKQLVGNLPDKQRVTEGERLRKQYEDQVALATKLETEVQKVANAETNRKAALAAMNVNQETFNTAMKDYWSIFLVEASSKAKGAILGGGNIQQETKAFADLMQTFQQLQASGGKGFDAKAYSELLSRSQQVYAMATTTDFDKQFIQWQTARLKAIYEASEAMKKLEVTPEGQTRDIQAELEKARQEAERTKGILDAMKPKAPADTTKEMKTSAEGADEALNEVSQTNIGGLVSQAQLLAEAMWNVAQASQMIAFPTGAAVTAAVTAAHGGMMWKFLAGGGPVGTDVIPAMLSPGEVVINAASARKFASQLTAINAGVQPAYRSEGGSVTNVGDINVTVNGGGSSRQTARSIASELRRELRRGTATL